MNTYIVISQLLVASIGSAFSIEINKYLINHNVVDSLSLPISVLSATGIGYLVFYILLKFPFRYRKIRKLLLPESCFEGYWMQAVNNCGVRYYTFMEIFFSRGSFFIKASSYLPDGQPKCNWNSTFVQIDADKHEMHYTYNASILNSDNGEDIKGYGDMRLEDAFEKIRGGSGNFTDQGINPIKCAFRFEDITSRYWKFEGEELNFLDKRRRFIISFHEYYSNSFGE